jgi:hypothetical protein
MAEENVSIDEFLSARKGFVKSGDVCVKGAASPPTSWDPKTRTARFVMSAEIEDLDKDIVVQEGLDIEQFLKNPVAPFSHRSSDFPVGKWANVVKILNGRPKRHEGDLGLVPDGKDGVADRLAFHIGEGTIRACSIGFIPKRVRRREQSQPADGYQYAGYMIEEATLLECSPCSIPANPAALAKSAAAGDVVAKEIIEQVLDEWAKNPANGLLMPRSAFEDAYKSATGDKSLIVLGGKTFKIEEVAPPEPAHVDPVAKTILERIETLFAKAFPPAKNPEVQAAEAAAAEAAAAEADEAVKQEKAALAADIAELEGRVAPKIAA